MATDRPRAERAREYLFGLGCTLWSRPFDLYNPPSVDLAVAHIVQVCEAIDGPTAHEGDPPMGMSPLAALERALWRTPIETGMDSMSDRAVEMLDWLARDGFVITRSVEWMASSDALVPTRPDPTVRSGP